MGSVFEGRDPDDCMEGSYLVKLKQDEESDKPVSVQGFELFLA